MTRGYIKDFLPMMMEIWDTKCQLRLILLSSVEGLMFRSGTHGHSLRLYTTYIHLIVILDLISVLYP